MNCFFFTGNHSINGTLLVSWNVTRARASAGSWPAPGSCRSHVCVSFSDWSQRSWCGLSAAAGSDSPDRLNHLPPITHLLILPEDVCIFQAGSRDQFMTTLHLLDRCNCCSLQWRPAVRDQGATEPRGSECISGAVIVSGQRQYGSEMAACELPRRSSSLWGALGGLLFKRGKKPNKLSF